MGNKPSKDAELDATTENMPGDAAKQMPARKKHRAVKIIIGIMLILLIVPVLVAGWLGFVPGLSNIMGANKPRDLGVHYTPDDYASFQKKTSTVFQDFATAPDNPAKPGKKTIFANPKTVKDLKLSDEELTASVNELNWLWTPIKNAQIRITDNTLEVSGNLNVQYAAELVNFIGSVGYSQSDVEKAVGWGRKLASNAPIYIKANVSVANDQLTMQLINIQIGRFNIPADIASKVLYTGGSNSINRADNLEVKSATLTDGTFNFTGTYPSMIYVKHE